MKFLPLWIGVLLSSSCNEHARSTNESKKEVWLVSAEVYCFCVTENYTINQSFINTCSTSFSVHADELITPKHLLYSTNDKSIVERLRHVFFDLRDKIDTSNHGADARIVVLMKKNDQSADTLVFNGEYDFNLNSKYDFKYSFQVMDSIRRIISKDTITCE